MKLAFALFLVILTARLVAAPPQAAPAPAAAPDDLTVKEHATFDAVCAVCHEGNLIEGAFRSPAEWDELISRMQSYGAGGTPEQFTMARSHMLRTFGKANVNSAAAADLAPVLDITPEQAAAVVAYRAQNGRFASLDDLKKVPGLDAAKIDARRDRVSF